jgi:hypothetical protein
MSYIVMYEMVTLCGGQLNEWGFSFGQFLKGWSGISGWDGGVLRSSERVIHCN